MSELYWLVRPITPVPPRGPCDLLQDYELANGFHCKAESWKSHVNYLRRLIGESGLEPPTPGLLRRFTMLFGS